MFPKTPREIRLVLRRTQVHADDLFGATEQMHMRVVESGNDETAARIDHARARRRQLADFGGRPDTRNYLAADRDGFCSRTCSIDSMDPSVDDHQVGDAFGMYGMCH